MKKIYILIACGTLLASCASDDGAAKTTYNSPGCQTQNFKINGQPNVAKVCLEEQEAPKPIKILAQINDEVIYEGESNAVQFKFKGTYIKLPVVGGCFGVDKIVRADTKKNIEFSAFPEDLTKACNIKKQPDGSSSNFVRINKECESKIGAFLKSTDIKVIPTEEAKNCMMYINKKPVFAKTFKLAN